MTLLSGIVGIIDENKNLIEVRDLGSNPVAVKAAFVLPIVDKYPPLPANGSKYSEPIIEVGETEIVRTYTVIGPNPVDYPLSDKQLRIGLIMAGIPLSTITAAIANIPDLAQRAIAEVWWDRSIEINWDHPMTQSFISMIGLTVDQAKTLWLTAKDLPV